MATQTPGTQLATTTPGTTAGADNSDHNSTSVETLKKIGDWTKGHLFVIYLAAASIVTLLALQANGFIGAFKYSWAIGTIIGFFSVAVFAYPFILAITKRQHTVLRIAIMLGSTAYAFFLLPLEVRLLGDFGSALWAVPVLGPVILPVAAIILSATTALLLARYGSKDLDMALQQDEAKLPGLRATLVDAEVKISTAHYEVSARKALEAVKQTAYDALSVTSQEIADTYKAAKVTFDNSPSKQLQDKLKREMTDNVRFRSETLDETVRLKAEVKKNNGALKDSAERKLKDAEARYLELTSEEHTLETKLDKVNAEVEQSPEKIAMEAALAKSETATNAATVAQDELTEVSKLAKAAESELSVQSDVHKGIAEKIDNITARSDEAHKLQRGDKRSVAFFPILTQLAAFVLYTVWYGWVLTTIPLG